MAGPDRTASTSSRHREQKLQPPRPPNAWILYRSHKFSQIRQSNERLSQAAVSKLISDMWKNESEHVKREFERMAEDRKAEHQQLYPDYRFAPQKREDKVRAKEDRKQSRLAKKSKARAATSSNATTSNATPTPVVPPIPFIPQHLLLHGYQPFMPHPYAIPFIPPQMHSGLGGLSPSISAAPSPMPCEGSESSDSQPRSGDVTSSSSSPSVGPSSSSSSQVSRSSSQIPVNPLYIPPLPGSHQPSPNLDTTLPLPPMFYDVPAPSRLPPPPATQAQHPPENTVTHAASVWNNIQASSPNPNNSNEVVKLSLPVSEIESQAQMSGGVSRIPSLRGLISRTDQNGIFSFSNICPSFLTQPSGELEVSMGPQASTVDYRGEPFVDYELMEFQRQMAEFTGDSSSTPANDPSIQEDLKALFDLPKDASQPSTDDQQPQSSFFAEDMMSFLDFDNVEGSTEDTSATVSHDPLSTAVPQHLLFQSTEQVAPAPIFIPMTNTPAVPFTTSYVPPAGAIYSSTRRVAGTWKLPFTFPPEDPAEAWVFPTNQ